LVSGNFWKNSSKKNPTKKNFFLKIIDIFKKRIYYIKKIFANDFEFNLILMAIMEFL